MNTVTGSSNNSLSYSTSNTSVRPAQTFESASGLVYSPPCIDLEALLFKFQTSKNSLLFLSLRYYVLEENFSCPCVCETFARQASFSFSLCLIFLDYTIIHEYYIAFE